MPQSLDATPPTFLQRLFQPVDIASRVFFRIAFGALLLYEVVRYARLGRVTEYWVEPTFHFTYPFFDWVQPWPGIGMYVHWGALGLLALLILLGCCYRVAMTLFFLGFTHVFLLEESKYLNHFYFISLVSFLMIFVPAHRALSVDAWLRPSLRTDNAPAWSLWMLCAQMGLVYFYGGVAKLNPDWLSGEPMRFWLATRTDYPLLGPLFAQEWMALLFSWGGLLFDLSVVPLLLWRRTRVFALLWAVSFHVLNHWMLGVGIFPWFSIAATSLFFAPDWPRRLLRRAGTAAVRAAPPSPLDGRQLAVVALLGAYLLVQLLVPLRKHLYPGAVNWTEEGHNFSWHMKLRDKWSAARFIATDPATGESWQVPLGDHLTPRQIRKMSIRPHMILKFSHHLARTLETSGELPVEVRAQVFCSLNGRQPQLLVDPHVNLAAVEASWRPAGWILPLREPLPPPETTRLQAAAARGEPVDEDLAAEDAILIRYEGD